MLRTFSWPGTATAVGVVFGLYLSSRYSYLLFHSLVETFTIVVSWGIFVVFWNTRRFLDNGCFLTLGVAQLWIAGIDLLHMLAYTGMGVFPETSANLPTELWIAGRYLQSAALLVAPWLVRHRPRPALAMGVLGLITLALLVAIFGGHFPPCFEEGIGLTPFKVASEYAICAVLAFALASFTLRRRAFDPAVFGLVISCIGLTIAAEMAFTRYISAYGAANLVGHLLRMLAFWLLYKAFVEVGLSQPQSLLFRELAQARDEAQQANLAKGRFLANVSHELRTPMNAVLGMTELALAEELPATARDYLQTAFQSGSVLLTLLNELLDFSRLEAGKFPLERRPFDIAALVDETLRPLAVRAREKGLRFDYALTADVPSFLRGDPLRLRQVLVNLVGNAIKFTHQGQVDVKVAVEESDSAEVLLACTVADTGIGISAVDQQRIFAPFTQANDSTARNFGGTGLGLAISASLVNLMGGRIWVQSEQGQGSTFRFTVRLARADSDGLRQSAPPEPATRPVLPPARRLKVLVADDTPTNQKLVDRVLGKRGHLVEAVDNGPAAVRRVADDDFDVVLMDLTMPGMDGFEATAAIRGLAHPMRSRVPIVALTAHAMRGDSQRCLESGMNAYLAKPFASRELIGMVESLARNPDSTTEH